MTELLLWPGDEAIPPVEEVRAEPGPKFITKLSRPSLTLFPASAPPGAPTVIVCPGGGYWGLASDHEGEAICRWLNGAGFHSALLKYRLPAHPEGPERFVPALEDAQRALCLIRAHGEEGRIKPGPVGIMGFSAGGHLSACCSNTPELRRKAGDFGDDFFSLPDFTVLIYPAYLDPDDKGVLCPEAKVTDKTPPAFLVHTLDDGIHHASSRTYSRECHRHGVPAELHLFPKGGHGYGMDTKEEGLRLWPTLLAAWLNSLRR